MILANNIKSIIAKIENANKFMKFVENCSQSKAINKSLVGTLMSTLTIINFDGSYTIQEYVLEMTNLVVRLKTM